MTETPNRNALYEQITTRIITELEQGKIPWVKPWVLGIPPSNAISKKPYQGINHLLLSLTSFDNPFFLTFKQAKELGGYVRQGEKGHQIIYWKLNRITETDPETLEETETNFPVMEKSS